MGTTLPVDGRAVVCFLDGAGGRRVEARAEGVQVGLHEPREGFEVDEFDGVGGGGVADNGLGASALLAVAVDGARCK